MVCVGVLTALRTKKASETCKYDDTHVFHFSFKGPLSAELITVLTRYQHATDLAT